MRDDCIRGFLQQAGIASVGELRQLSGGRNNQIFRIRENYILKKYFFHKDDNRKRVEHEFKFLTFAWNHGVRSIPQPIYADYQSNIALYSYVKGRKLNSDEIDADKIKQAAEFFFRLNIHKFCEDAGSLPNAAESAFSLSAHIDNIQRRIERITQIDATSELVKKAMHFVQAVLVPAWDDKKREFYEQAAAYDIDINKQIPEDERCISPSDFGFHNALQQADGAITFLDFEYAGWDDPVKMICDFFSQPELPVTLEYFDEFVRTCFERPDAWIQQIQKKVNLFLPLNYLKWCCIMLNDFLRIDNERRSFAERKNADVRKKEQLDRTKEYFIQYLTTNQH